MAKRSEKDPEGLRFFFPESLGDLTAALAWLDARATGPADDVWYDYSGDQGAWSVLALPSPHLHPRGLALLATTAGVSPEAFTAVLDRQAFVDDDDELRIWPWYPEEDANAAPIAKAQARALGIGLPREHLDEPYEPAHYLRRATSDALDRWLAARSIDGRGARIDRVPIPPRARYKEERFEGGMKAPSPQSQAIGALLQTARLYAYIGEDAEQRAQIDARLDRDLAIACDRIAGAPARSAAPVDADPYVLPELEEARRPIGRVVAIFALDRGALLVTDGALLTIDPAGALTGAWPLPQGEVWAARDLVIVNDEHCLDLALGRFVAGARDDLLRRLGLEGAPSTSGHDERTNPVISSCGRYLLDVDESPYIIRLADRMIVAEGIALERAIAEPRSQEGLVRPEQVTVAPATVIDGVRFTIRTGEAPVRDGRPLAFALAGDHWRFLAGDAVRERGRTIARIGVPILGAAFGVDAKKLWALASDHVICIDLEGPARVETIALVEPLLREAAEILGAPR